MRSRAATPGDPVAAGLIRWARPALTRLTNEASSPMFARRAIGIDSVPAEAVAVFFATGPENLYQFDQWQRPLEGYAHTRPVVILLDRPDTGRRLQARTGLPVVYARGSAPLEHLVRARAVRVVLYLNQVEPNFRMLRFAAPVHVQIGHGDSDKGGSVSHQHQAYDLTFVGGPAGRDRLAAELRGFDADVRTRQVGRPQLDHDYPGAPPWPRDSGRRIVYAPTWEGDRASIAYGSLASHGVALVDALRAEADVRMIYRPHPRTGQTSPAHAAADREIRRRLALDGSRHWIDRRPGYGWHWAFADCCVTDVSALAYDWLATGKPLVVTEPPAGVHRAPSALLDVVTRLPAARAVDVGAAIAAAAAVDLTALTSHYFGDTTRGASTARFEAALEEAARVSSGG